MSNERTIGIIDCAFQSLELSRDHVFAPGDPPRFTRLGSHLYGLFVVHKNEIIEARRDGRTTEERLYQMVNEEIEERLAGIEGIWCRKIPRNGIVTAYLEHQFNAIMKEESILLSNATTLTKK
ncbi:MAG: hypothetical protein AAB600_00010 [Patescibacteria group bacterium]